MYVLYIVIMRSLRSNNIDYKNSENITLYHECPCRIEKSHLSGQNFNQGLGLQSPWLNSNPKGEIQLSFIDKLTVDCFSHYSKFFCHNINSKKVINLTFYSLDLYYFRVH